MVKEVLEHLVWDDSGTYVDLTMGAGGHARAALDRFPSLRWVGFDRDAEILSIARERLTAFGDRVTLIHGRWADIERELHACGVERVAGALLDLGVSSLQLDRAERGFSFQQDGPLDMRLDQRSKDPSAAELLATAPEEEIARWLFEYGEERHARRIAREIVSERTRVPLRRTSDLVRLVERVMPYRPAGKSRIHVATRTFQGLRIRVNRELEDIEAVLPSLHGLLQHDGRLVVLAYHSLEDRIVKAFVRERVREGSLEALNAKPIEADRSERRENPRSRSAKLRAARRLASR